MKKCSKTLARKDRKLCFDQELNVGMPGTFQKYRTKMQSKA